MDPTPATQRPPATPPIRMLIVEHEEADVELSLLALKREGLALDVDIAATPPDFKAKLESNTYDVVLADYRLPSWTGMDALKEIQNRGLNLPLILVTGTLGEENAVECIKLGVSDYVLKDRLSRLPMAVRRALEQKTLRDERARNVRTLEENAASFRFLFAKNPIPMMVFDQNTLQYLEINDACIALYGYSREEFLRLRVTDICAPDERPRLIEHMLQEHGELLHAGIWRHCLKDGRVIDVDVLVHKMEFAGHSARLVATFDVTERQALERQLREAQKFEAIGQLAGGIAHDFNNMLGAILGWAELGIDETGPEPRIRGYFQKVQHQAERAAALTRQLLAFARRQILEPRNIDLNRTVRDVTGLLGKVIRSDIELKLLLADDLPAVKADPTQAEQVLMNLCLNARDAMPNGGTLEICTRPSEITDALAHSYKDAKPGLYVLLSVCDTGTGIEPATLERIFEPFFTTKQIGKGTGLGLAMVYGIIKQHGGFIHVESAVGAGTQFHIYLPAAAVEEISEPQPESTAPVRGGQETVLIVEDHDGLREIASTTLAALGYHVRLAHDGEEAIEQFRAHRGEIALVLLDVVLPKLGGPEAYSRMCAEHPGLPVLFVTGYSGDVDALRFVQDHKLPLLQKPYGPRDLAQKVREALDRSLNLIPGK